MFATESLRNENFDRLLTTVAIYAILIVVFVASPDCNGCRAGYF